MTLHPAASLLLWAAGVVLLQSLDGNPMRGLVLCLAPIVLMLAPARLVRLVRRARWLLVVLFAVFAWSVPGHLLWPAADWASPTAEGLALAIDHTLRLFGLLMLVAVLLERMSQPRLLEGLYALMRPFAGVGVDRARTAIRLVLVLRYVEQDPPRRQWRQWLYADNPVEAGAPVTIELHRASRWDMAAVTLAATVCAVAWLA